MNLNKKTATVININVAVFNVKIKIILQQV